MSVSGAEYKRQLRRTARAYVNAYLAKRSCADCGNPDPRVLQFHHNDPKEKVLAVSNMVSRGMHVSLIKKEIAKTTVLCANCHSIRHHKERNGK